MKREEDRDHIDHHKLMDRVRQRIGDGKLNRLILAFLQSGVLSETQFTRTDSGTPQGGILSPLLANVALSIIEERYERHVWPRAAKPKGGRGRPAAALSDPTLIARRAFMNRASDRRAGRCVMVPVRYADDFVILVCAGDGAPDKAREIAEQEKASLAAMLSAEMGLTLSPEKTLVTPVTETLRFLGHHLRVRKDSLRRQLRPRLVILQRSSEPSMGSISILNVIPADLIGMDVVGIRRGHVLRKKRLCTGIRRKIAS